MDIMTLSAYEKNKPAIYKWRELNKEKYNDISNKAQRIYFENNKDRISKCRKEYHLRKKSHASLFSLNKSSVELKRNTRPDAPFSRSTM